MVTEQTPDFPSANDDDGSADDERHERAEKCRVDSFTGLNRERRGASRGLRVEGKGTTEAGGAFLFSDALAPG